ncbi:MAG: hypothetical protein ACYCUT_10235 [bacterium]
MGSNSNFNWASFISGILGGLLSGWVGGLLAGKYSVKAADKTIDYDKEKKNKAERSQIKSILQNIYDEINDKSQYIQQNIGPNIKKLNIREEKPFTYFSNHLDDFQEQMKKGSFNSNDKGKFMAQFKKEPVYYIYDNTKLKEFPIYTEYITKLDNIKNENLRNLIRKTYNEVGDLQKIINANNEIKSGLDNSYEEASSNNSKDIKNFIETGHKLIDHFSTLRNSYLET